MNLRVDDDVPFVDLMKAFKAVGLTISNLGGWNFRLRRIESVQKVIDLAERRDARTDAQIRDAMHTAFDPPAGPDVA